MKCTHTLRCTFVQVPTSQNTCTYRIWHTSPVYIQNLINGLATVQLDRWWVRAENISLYFMVGANQFPHVTINFKTELAPTVCSFDFNKTEEFRVNNSQLSHDSRHTAHQTALTSYEMHTYPALYLCSSSNKPEHVYLSDLVHLTCVHTKFDKWSCY
jgi:hypothetical protein